MRHKKTPPEQTSPRRHVPAILAAAGTALAICMLVGTMEAQARSSCGQRTSVQFGETTEAVARRCGVNVEALRALNPGLDAKRPPQGTIVTAPPRPLPSATPPSRGNPAFALPRTAR